MPRRPRRSSNTNRQSGGRWSSNSALLRRPIRTLWWGVASGVWRLRFVGAQRTLVVSAGISWHRLGLSTKVCGARSEIRTTLCGRSAVTVRSLRQGKAKIDRDPRGSNFFLHRPPRLLLNSSMILSPRPGRTAGSADPLSVTLHFANVPTRNNSTQNLACLARETCRAALFISSNTIIPAANTEPPTAAKVE